MAKRIQVGGRIESQEVGGIVTGAAEILDDAKGKKQSVINGETDDELVRLDQSKQNNLTFDNAPTEGSDNPVKSGGVYAADKALSDAIEAILLLIPSAASALNKLVDTAMMNSSISTATATFRGTYNVVTDLSLTVDATHEQIVAALGNVISTADNNDYAFVQVPVSAESTDIRRTERYKFNGTVWGYEYDLNTSGFTAAQWAAINSGITIALVGKLIGLPTSSELMALLGQKQDTLTFDNIPTSGSANPVKSGGVYSAINEEKTAREQLAQSVTGINGRLGNVEDVIPSGAAANNKLVANNSMEAYVTSIIEAITASFTIATADGHINLSLTQTNGRVASLTLTSSDIASAQALTALTGRVSTAEGNITSLGGRMTTAESNITTINSNITSLGGRVSMNETDIANLQQLYNDLQQSKPVPVTALPETGQQQGVIYRLAGTTSYSDYMWNGSTWVLMATYNNAIDPRPKKNSQNLVTSGGIFDNMGALDVSELNATENPHTLAQYTDLSAALAAIPTDYQKGGMSIKFVQSSDNKYVQYRLMSNSFNTTIANWQGVDDEPTAGSENLVKSGGVFDYFKRQDSAITPNSIYTYTVSMAQSIDMMIISDNKWVKVGGDYNQGCAIPMNNQIYKSIKIEKTGPTLRYAFLKNIDNVVAGDTPDYCSGCGFEQHDDLNSIIVDIPDDANYLYYYYVIGYNLYLPNIYGCIPFYEYKQNNLWKNKMLLFWGDSITEINNNKTLLTSWGNIIAREYQCDFYSRGWGSTFLSHQRETRYVDANGLPCSQETTGSIAVNNIGMCDYDRITKMIPASIKDSIDIIIIKGGINDINAYGTGIPFGTTEFITRDTLPSDTTDIDVEWFNSPLYTGGDYDITTINGSICSMIMKFNKYIPNAKIIFASPMNAFHYDTGTPFMHVSTGKTVQECGEEMMNTAKKLSVDIIDINRKAQIGLWDWGRYLGIDGVHPYSSEGCLRLGNAFIGGMRSIMP